LKTYRLEEFYGLLAYHYAKAENWERAQDYLLKAGDQAGKMAADAEALTHYQQAMAAYARAFGDKRDPMQRAALERNMGEALSRRGDHQQALDHLERALNYLGHPLPQSRWGVRLAIIKELAQQVGHRLWPGLFLKNVGGEASPAVVEEVLLYEAMSWIEVFANAERFLLVSLRELNVSERSGFHLGVVLASTGVGFTCDFISASGLAERYHRRAVALAEQIQHPAAVGLAYYGLSAHGYYLGMLDSCIEHGQQATNSFRQVGNLRSWGAVNLYVALVFANRSDFPRALASSQALIRSGQEGADPQVWSFGLYVQGYVQRYMGRLEEAIVDQQQVLKLAETVPDYITCILAGSELGNCYIYQGLFKHSFERAGYESENWRRA